MLFINGTYRESEKASWTPFRFHFPFPRWQLDERKAVLFFVAGQLSEQSGQSAAHKVYKTKGIVNTPEGYEAEVAVLTYYSKARIRKARDSGEELRNGELVAVYKILINPHTT